MTKKKKVYDTTLIDSIRLKTALYDAMFTPKVNTLEYVHAITNPSVAGENAPDNFGFTDWASNSFYNWSMTRASTNRDTALGEFTMADLDYNTLISLKDYIEADNQVLSLLDELQKDPTNKDIADLIDRLNLVKRSNSLAYNTAILGKFNDKSLNVYVTDNLKKEKLNNVLAEIDKQITPITRPDGSVQADNIYNKRIISLREAEEYSNKVKLYDSKITSDYYRSKKDASGMDLTDIDTYLYKLPGLMGSSASTLGATVLGTAAAWYAASAGNPLAAIAGAGVSIASNIYSRDKESKAEVYQNYKQSVLNTAKKLGIDKNVLADAKIKMALNGYKPEQINDDDYVYDQILSGKIKLDNVKFNRAMLNNREGLQSLYTDNMALSAVDIAQQAIEVIPLASIARKIKGLKTLVDKGVKKYRGIQTSLSDRIDDVTSFGIENIDKLPSRTKRKVITDLGGRILISSMLEGQEEGVQYIKGQRYINNEFDPDPNLAKSFVKNLGTGARSIFAAITPWDPVYSDDKEFMENFKGGALLGGLMTGVFGAPSAVIQYRNRLPTDLFVSALYTEQMDAKDRVRKNAEYGRLIRTGRYDNLMNSFDEAEKLVKNIEGLELADIQAERKKAETLRNIYTSPSTIRQAASIGIDPRTGEYDIFVALKEHHDQLLTEAAKNRSNIESEVEQLMYSSEITEHIQRIKPDATPDEEANIRTLIRLKSLLDQYDKLITDFTNHGLKLEELEKNTGLRTSKTDVIKFKHLLNTDKEQLNKQYQQILDNAKDLGITEDQLEVPTVHQTLKDLQEKEIAANLDFERAKAERDVMNNSKGVKAKINKWLEVEDNEDTFVQELDDLYSGKQEEEAIVNSEEVGPEPLEKETPTEEKQPTTKARRGDKQINKYLGELRNANTAVDKLNAVSMLLLNAQQGAELTEAEQKEILEAIESAKAEGYEISPLLGKKYNSGMKVIVLNFIPDDNAEPGSSVITGVRKPQILKDGVLHQAAEIIVTQGPEVKEQETEEPKEVKEKSLDKYEALRNTLVKAGLLKKNLEMPDGAIYKVNPYPLKSTIFVSELEAQSIRYRVQSIFELHEPPTRKKLYEAITLDHVTATEDTFDFLYRVFDAVRDKKLTVGDLVEVVDYFSIVATEEEFVNMELTRLEKSGKEPAVIEEFRRKFAEIKKSRLTATKIQLNYFKKDSKGNVVPDPDHYAGGIWHKAGKAMEDVYRYLNPNRSVYKEYSAAIYMEDSEDGLKNLWQDMRETKMLLEEELYTSGPSPLAIDIADILDSQIKLSEFIIDSHNKIAQRLKDQAPARLEEMKQAREEEKQAAIKREEIKKEDRKKVIELDDKTPVKSKEAEPVAPSKPTQEKPAKVETPTLSDILGGWLGEEAGKAMQQPEAPKQVETPTTVNTQPITYNRSEDPYSHEINYRLGTWSMDANGRKTRTSKKYQGMEEYLNDNDLALISANLDFVPEVMKNGVHFEVKSYTDPNGVTSPAIYAIFLYKGKKYAGAIKTVEGGLRGNRYFSSLPFDKQTQIINNLVVLRNKIIELYELTKSNPNLEVVPTAIRTTTGQFINEKNEDGSPKNRSLLDSAWLTIKDPMEINPSNTFIGITTGPRGNRNVRIRENIVSNRGGSLGQPMWELRVPRLDGGFDKKLVKLNYQTFADQPKIADLILNLVTSNEQFYIDAKGVKTNLTPLNVLDFIVNFGSHTAVNPEDANLTQDQIQALLKKLFFVDDNGNIVLGTTTYSISDLISQPEIREQAKKYIMDNFHWNIDEQSLNRYYLGGDLQSKVSDPRFKSVAAFLKNSDVDKITIIPGLIELDQNEFGIVKDSNGNKTVDTKHPNGMSTLGWMIKQGILLTDIADNLWNSNIYIDDVILADKSARNVQQQASEKVDKAATENPLADKTFTLPDETGKSTTIDMADIYRILDGKKRGPNMEVEVKVDDKLWVNERIDPKQATEWLSNTLGITPELVPTVVDLTEAGASVVGRATKDSILLSELAPIGTEYHEAFHRVSLLLIDDKRRNRIYSRMRKNNPQMTDKLIEEALAEQFREFMLNESGNYAFDTKNWFRRILDFIKLWARTGSYSLARIYSDINRGKFYGVKPNESNVARFRLIYSGDGPNMEVAGYELKSITSYKQFDDVIKSLTYAFFATNGSVLVPNIEYSALAEDNKLFERLKLIIEALATHYPSVVMDEILEKYESVFMPTIASRLKQLGIRAVDRNEDDTISKMEEGVETVNVGQHIVEGMNVSIKDNAPAEVKFFFQTIPQYEIGPDGSMSMKIDPITHFASFVDSNSAWNSILKDLSGCRTIYNMIDRVAMYANNGSTFHSALLFKLTKLINDSNQTEDLAKAADAEAMLTKIETVVTCDINNYITAKVSKDPETGFTKHELIDNTVDTKAITYPKVWSLALFTNSGLFKYDSKGNVIAENGSKAALTTTINNFNTVSNAFIKNKGILKLGDRSIDLHVPANLKMLKKYLVGLFNMLGIGIDVPTIDKMLMSGRYGDPKSDQFTLLNNFITSTVNFGGILRVVNTLEAIKNAINEDGTLKAIKANDVTIEPDLVWNNIGYVKELANYYAATHATDNSLSSYGPDGNTYYMVSLNNFAKDRLNEIISDSEVFAELESVVYNQHSILLQAVRSGNRDLTMETFINFKDTTTGDKGRDYHGITDREDYIAKMTAVLNDRIIFPTVADKKTYHFINGVTLPHETIRFEKIGDMTNATYGEQALDYLLGYCYDELNQIELCLRQTDDDPTHYNKETGLHYNDDGTVNNDWLEPSQRIKNFHTPNKYNYKDKDGVKHTVTLEGNGARFLFLTGIYLDGLFINFNDPTKSSKECLQLAKDYFFNLSKDTQKAFLSGIISRRVKEEIQYAKELGLITANEENKAWSLRNVLLDDNVVQERKSRYMQFDAANAEGYAVFDVISDYVINSIVSIQEIEKIFSGAPAYYKVKYDRLGIVDVSIDKIKRLGSLTSTGLNNRLDFFNDPMRDEYTVTELKDHEIMDKQYHEYEHLFYRANIKEAIQEMVGVEAWNEVKDLGIKEIEKKYPEEVKIAKNAAKVAVAGYKKGVNVADAAVYISPNMTRDLLRMRGVWSADVKKAFEILTNPDTADKWESDPKLYAEANKVILNAMKYVAFGTRFRNGLGIPYFNKMALFPLFKSVATGDIKALYDRMVDSKDPIDMVMFNSAVKAGSQSATSFYRNAKDSEIELKDGQTTLSASIVDVAESGEGTVITDLSKLVTYKLKFKYIRQLLETNPHTHPDQMAGTQFLKVNLSNLRMDDLYGPENYQVTGKEINDTVMDALNKLSDMGKLDIVDELFTDGEVNITALGKMLERDARESDANDNILSGLKTKNNAFTIPLSALSDNKWLESRFISMINKTVIDVHMPGGAFIQRSAFGLNATSLNVITENMINDGKPLLMINEKDGSMDSVVSINLFKHDIPGYERMTFREARLWLIDHNIIGLSAEATGIGYRIPTQSVASISALRFVDVFPEIMGDTIMLPEGFTKLTGSDFDIDKLYVARYSFNKKGGIITHGGALIREDVKSAYKNDIIRMYLKILLTKENSAMLKGSIDDATERVKDILADIEGKSTFHPAPFEVYTPRYLEARKAEYTGGKAGIGPFALNNAHHILTQLVGLKIDMNPFIEDLGIIDVGRIYDYPTEGNPMGGRILDWLSAMINAFVDIAKDPYIVRLNVNAWTYNMVSFLLRTGKGAQTFYFIRQPILVEMANEVLKTKGKYGIDRTKTPSQLEKEAIEKVLNKYDPTGNLRKKYQTINKDDGSKAKEYADLFKTYKNEKGEETSRTRQLLKIKPEDNRNYNEEQVRIYYAWLALKPYADDLANLVKFSKIDTKKTGKTFAELDIYYKGMKDMEENSVFAEGEVTRFFDGTFIRNKTENSIPLGASIFRNLLFRNTDQFTNQKHIVLSLLGRATNADSKLLNAVINGMEALIKSQFFNQYVKDNNIDLSTMFHGRNSVPSRLYRFKQEILKGNPRLSHLLNNDGTIANDFVNYLIPNLNKDGLDFIDRSELLNPDQSQANNLINYWRLLLDDPEPSVKRLFRDLAVYSFYTSGDNSVMNGFFQYLPNSERTNMGYTLFVQEKLELMVNNANFQYNDLEDLFLNNWQNDKLVRPVDMYGGEYKSPLRSISLNDEAVMPNIILGQRTDMKDPVIRPLNWVTVNGATFPIFPPYTKVRDSLGFGPENWHVYRLIGYIDKPEFSKSGKPTGRITYIPMYGLISKKGYSYRGHTIVEYGKDTQFDFNKENEWNYTEALDNKEALVDMASDIEKSYLEADTDFMHLIGELPSYSGMNYALAELNRVFEYEQDDADESIEGVVLEEADEPITKDNSQQISINVYAGTNENADLSNFATRPFTYQNVKYNTVEGAFLALKLNYSNYTDSNVSERYIEMLNRFANATGAEARKLGRSITGLDRQSWDTDSELILKETMKASFEQNPEAKQRLLDTGNAIITHKNRQSIELDNGRFSRLLMGIRDEFKDKAFNNTSSTNNDPENFASVEESKLTIQSDKTILSNKELIKLRPYAGNNPRIAVASEHTDPVFFSKKIIEILDGKLSVLDKFRNTSYTGNDFAALYLITKHDGLPLKNLLEYKIPKLIHFSITGLGGTKWEPGVMKYNDLLDRIQEFIKQGLDSEMVTVRIDPIVPGVTLISDVENIVRRASEMGIKNIRFSVMDQYSTTKKFMEELGYDYSKFYDSKSLHARPEVLQSIENKMLELKNKYGVNMSTCAEPFNIEGISKEACLSVAAINNMLGTSIPETATGKQRQLCSCYGGKTDLLRYDNKCASSCIYCYAHHNNNKNLNYYNEDGTLKDNPFTRTSESMPNNANEPISNLLKLQFVRAFAEDWSEREGWSVDYFMTKVLPRIDEAWQIEYELAPDLSINVDSKHTATMNYNYGKDKRDDIKSKSTLEAIKNGERTSTTRYESDGHIDFWKKFKDGDIVRFVKKDNNGQITDDVKVVITNVVKLGDIFQLAFNKMSSLNVANIISQQLKELTGVDLIALYDQGNKRISEVLDTLDDLTIDERQTYLNEFTKYMRDNNINTQDKLEEALRKFICNL